MMIPIRLHAYNVGLNIVNGGKPDLTVGKCYFLYDFILGKIIICDFLIQGVRCQDIYAKD